MRLTLFFSFPNSSLGTPRSLEISFPHRAGEATSTRARDGSETEFREEAVPKLSLGTRALTAKRAERREKLREYLPPASSRVSGIWRVWRVKLSFAPEKFLEQLTALVRQHAAVDITTMI